MWGWIGKSNSAATPSRAISLRRSPRSRTAPARSDAKTKGDCGSCSRFRRRKRPQLRPGQRMDRFGDCHSCVRLTCRSSLWAKSTASQRSVTSSSCAQAVPVGDQHHGGCRAGRGGCFRRQRSGDSTSAIGQVLARAQIGGSAVVVAFAASARRVHAGAGRCCSSVIGHFRSEGGGKPPSGIGGGSRRGKLPRRIALAGFDRGIGDVPVAGRIAQLDRRHQASPRRRALPKKAKCKATERP